MKVTCKFSAWMLSALLAGSMFSGCTSDSLGLPSGEGDMKLGPVKAADIVAYSGTTVHGSTFAGGTRSAAGEDSGWAKTWDPDTWDGTKWHEILNAPKLNAATWDPEEWECIPNVDLSEEDIAEIRRLLREAVPCNYNARKQWAREKYEDLLEEDFWSWWDEHKDSLARLIPDVPYEAYKDCWVQYVYKGENVYEFEKCFPHLDTPRLNKPDPIKGSDYMVLCAWCEQPKDMLYYRHYTFVDDGTLTLDIYTSSFQRIDFRDSYSQEVCSCGETHEGTILVEDLISIYGSNPNFVFPSGVFESLSVNDKYEDKCQSTYTKVIIYKGEYYVGFQGRFRSPNLIMDTSGYPLFELSNLWVAGYSNNYDDWIIKLTPAHRKSNNGAGNDDSNYGAGDDDSNHGAGDNNGDNATGDNDSNHGVGNDDSNHAAWGHDNEVEVNLSVNEAQKSGYPASHLSLHVRTATNVEAFIPVSAEHYAGKGLTDILMMHDKNHLVSSETQTTEYTIGGNTVTLNIEYQAEGIRIWTEGINEEVIAYCRERFNDGITFEVWNYYNDGADTGTLKPMLDGTTVKFTDSLPDYYINAFGKAGDELDCTVGIADEQRGDYGDGEEGAHLNGSDKNLIYTKR